MSDTAYPIGVPGLAWGARERQRWFAVQQKQRDYRQVVLSAVESLAEQFALTEYGDLSFPQVEANYPLCALSTRAWVPARPAILITGGVHGYETSGVHGALAFLASEAQRYERAFNFVVAPCVSPWAYETINRWNPDAEDPNRAFVLGSSVPEAALLMAFVARQGHQFLAHIDLHETTDTDNSEFRPAKAARDGEVLTDWPIPDGFYLVADSANPQPAFQQAIINAVASVTHIAPADADGTLIGEPLLVPGVVTYPKRSLGLCAGFSGAPYVTTTEVYPDSPRATPEQCVRAQLAAVCGALDFLAQLPRNA